MPVQQKPPYRPFRRLRELCDALRRILRRLRAVALTAGMLIAVLTASTSGAVLLARSERGAEGPGQEKVPENRSTPDEVRANGEANEKESDAEDDRGPRSEQAPEKASPKDRDAEENEVRKGKGEEKDKGKGTEEGREQDAMDKGDDGASRSRGPGASEDRKDAQEKREAPEKKEEENKDKGEEQPPLSAEAFRARVRFTPGDTVSPRLFLPRHPLLRDSSELSERLRATLTGSGGQTLPLTPSIRERADGYAVTLRPPALLRPSRAHLTVTLSDGLSFGRRLQRLFSRDTAGDERSIVLVSEELAFGSILINTDRALYMPGDEARVTYAFLDEAGMPISSPVTATERGHTFHLQHAGQQVERTIPVSEDPLVTLERSAPHITTASAGVVMVLTVTPQHTFLGPLTETVPPGFTIRTSSPPAFVRQLPEGSTILTWERQWEEGSPITLRYVVTAPHTRTPLLTLFGPVEVRDTSIQTGEISPAVPPSTPPASEPLGNTPAAVSSLSSSSTESSQQPSSGSTQSEGTSSSVEGQTSSALSSVSSGASSFSTSSSSEEEKGKGKDDEKGKDEDKGKKKAGLPAEAKVAKVGFFRWFLSLLFPIEVTAAEQTLYFLEPERYQLLVLPETPEPLPAEAEKTASGSLTLTSEKDAFEAKEGPRFLLLDVPLPADLAPILDAKGHLRSDRALAHILEAVMDEEDLSRAVLTETIEQRALDIAEKGVTSQNRGKAERALKNDETAQQNVAEALEKNPIVQEELSQIDFADLRETLSERIAEEALQHPDIQQILTEVMAATLSSMTPALGDAAVAAVTTSPEAKDEIALAAALPVQTPSVLDRLLQRQGAPAAQELPLMALRLRTPTGDEIRDPPFHFEPGSVRLVLEPLRRFRPGRYLLTMTVKNPLTGEIETRTEDFSWGVLAINADSDRYKPGSEAVLHFGVLDDAGEIVCLPAVAPAGAKEGDAALTLTVTDPKGRVQMLSTKDKTITVTGTCGIKQAGFIEPDYEALLPLDQPGTYQLTLTATTASGTRSIDTEILVEPHSEIIVTRTAATRLYPVGPSPMTIEVEFAREYTGTITETVPGGFSISNVSPKGMVAENLDGTEQLTWEGRWRAGERAEFRYDYDAPDISPQFYLVGPLRFAPKVPGVLSRIHGATVQSTPFLEFTEHRSWQLANDAVSSPQTTADSLVGYWKFDEGSGGSGATITDSSGNGKSGTLYSTPTWSTSTSTISFHNVTALNFDGTNDYVRMGDVLDFERTDKFTIAAWQKAGATSPSAAQSIVSKQNHTGDFEGYLLSVRGEYAGDPYRLTLANNTSTSYMQTHWPRTNDTAWHHVAITYDGSSAAAGAQGYEDGVPKTMTTIVDSLSTTIVTSYPLEIGARNGSDIPFNGLIDDVRIYNRVLSAREISDLAAGKHPTVYWDGSASKSFHNGANWDTNAVPDPYTVVSFSGSTNIATLTGAIQVGGIRVATGVTIDLHGTGVTLTDSGTVVNYGILKMLGNETLTNFTNDTTHGTTLVYGSGTYTGLPTSSFYNLTLSDGLVGYWKLDDTSGVRAADSSGYGNSGSLVSGTTISTTVASVNFNNPRSLSFDGTNDYVDVGNTGQSTVKTMTFWMNANDVTTRELINFDDTDEIEINASSAITAESFPGTTTIYVNGSQASATVTAGVWQHVAITDTTGVNASNFEIGRTDGTNYYDGFLDDVRIFNRALSAAEIATLAAGNHPSTALGKITLNSNLAVANDFTLNAGELDASTSNYNLTVSGSFLNHGGKFTPRKGTVTLDGTTSGKEIQTGGQKFNNLTVNGSSGVWNTRDRLTASGTLTITSGTLDASGSYVIKAGTWTQDGGTFTPRSGTVVVTNAAASTLTPSSSFNTLRIEDPTENGLVGYWKFDEGTNTGSIIDASGNGNTGTRHGGTGALIWTGATLSGFSSLAFDNPFVMKFDGGNDYVDLGNATSVFTAQGTISAWVKTSADTVQGIVGVVNTGDTSNNFAIAIGNGATAFLTNEIITIIEDNAGNRVGYTTATRTELIDSNWHHVAVTGDGSSYAIYLDGNSKTITVGQGANNGDWTNRSGANAAYIGQRHSSTFFVNGLIDDVRIFNRALSANEVVNLYRGRYANGANGTAKVTLGGNLSTTALNIDAGTLSTSSYTTTVTNAVTLARGNGSYVIGSGLQTMNGGLTLSGSTITGGTGQLDVNGTVTIQTGSLLASTGAILVSGDWTKTGGYFRSGTGAVTFDGSGNQTLTSSGTDIWSDFNVLNVNKSAGTLSLASNALSGATLNVTAGTFAPGALAVTAGTLNVNGGTYRGSTGNLDLNGNWTLTSGTFTAPTGTFTVAGNWSKSGGTFTSSGATVTFDGTGDQTLNAGGTDSASDFTNVTVNKSAGTLSLSTNAFSGTLLTLTAGTVSPSALNATLGALTVDAGTFTGGAGTLDVNGDLTLNGGTFTAPSGTFTVFGTWLKKAAATFTPGTSTVTLDGPDQTLSGSTLFYNLSKTVTTARTLTLAATTTQTFSGALTLRGAASNLLSVRSSIAGVRAALALDRESGTQTIDYLDVKDSDASGGAVLVCLGSEGCLNSGNNLGFSFGVTGTGSITGTVFVDTDGDGSKESGETSGLQTVTVSVSGTTTTGGTLSLNKSTLSTGVFSFTGVTISNTSGYTVAVDTTTLPAGYLKTRWHSSGSNVLGTGGTLTVNFGYVQSSTLSGSVFVDLDEDRTKDSNETTVFSGTLLTLTGTSGTGGTVNATVRSTALGVYAFRNLPVFSGRLTITATPPSGYRSTWLDERKLTIAQGGTALIEDFGYLSTGNTPVSTAATETGGGGGGGGGRGGSLARAAREKIVARFQEQLKAGASSRPVVAKHPAGRPVVVTKGQASSVLRVGFLRPRPLASSSSRSEGWSSPPSAQATVRRSAAPKTIARERVQPVQEIARRLPQAVSSSSTAPLRGASSSVASSRVPRQRKLLPEPPPGIIEMDFVQAESVSSAAAEESSVELVRAEESSSAAAEASTSASASSAPPVTEQEVVQEQEGWLASSSSRSEGWDPSLPVQIAEKRGRLQIIHGEHAIIYKDVLVSAWYAPYVSLLLEQGIVHGYTDATGKPTGEFGAEKPVTFAELVKMTLHAVGKAPQESLLQRLLRLSGPKNRSARGTWAAPYVKTAEDLNVSALRPEVNVQAPATRGEVVQTMLEVFGIPIGKRPADFQDVGKDHPYTAAIGTAYHFGLIDGDTDADGTSLGTFRPDSPITRAEVTKIIALAKELLKHR